MAIRRYKENHRNAMRLRYGWRISHQGYHMIHGDQRKVVLEILRLRRDGLKLQQIVDYLNGKQYPTLRNSVWYCATVKKIIDQNSHLKIR